MTVPSPKQIAATLRALPNEWLPLVKGASAIIGSRVQKWRTGETVAAFRPTDAGHFEFKLKSAGYGSGLTWAYGRFVPRA